MRIVAFPYRGIAYNNAFYDAIEAEGVEIIAGEGSGRWLLKNLWKEDVVHIHWPSFLYKARGNHLVLLHSFFRFLLLFAIIRFKTRHIWWTAHNLLPHERCDLPVLDILARHFIVALSSRIFVHGAEAEAMLVTRFPRAKMKCVQIPHGNWIGYYQPLQTREMARTALDLPQDAFIYLCFGQAKPYKNIEGVIKAFLLVATKTDLLLIAGNFSDRSYLSKITSLAGGDARVRIEARFIPDHEVSAYLSASDVMCVPYHQILTSGTTMLALSFGKPVISINHGFLRDVISPETGILVDAGDEQALVGALRLVRERSWSSEAIVEHAHRFNFRDAAKISLNQVPGHLWNTSDGTQ